MRLVTIICLMTLLSCAQTRGPASTSDLSTASDSIALGNVKASAVKKVEDQNVCFDINLTMTGVEQSDASPANWTLAWVDHQEKYHLLKLNQRDPASVPQGGNVIAEYGYYKEWKNSFQTCANKARMAEVKALVLTPKELPYGDQSSLRLEWK